MNHRRRIKSIVFDLDDTLIDWSEQSMSSVELTQRHMGNVYAYLQKQGHRLPDLETFLDDFREVLVESWREAKKTWAGVAFHNVLHDTFRGLRLDMDQIDLEEVLQVYGWGMVPGVRPFDDTLAVLETLREKSYQIGLITNSMQPMWMRDIELEAYGILPFLDARTTSGDTGYMKPHPAIYRRLLDKLNSQPAETIFVGDSLTNDIAGANDAGLISVWKKSRFTEDRPLAEMEAMMTPDYVITDLSELLLILEELEET